MTMRVIALHSQRVAEPLAWLPRAAVAGLCAPFVASAWAKLLAPAAAHEEMLQVGLPWPGLMVWLVVTLQLAGSAGAIFGRGLLAITSALVLAAFTAAATLLAHGFWAHEGPERLMHSRVFFEHVAIVAGLMLAAWWHWRVAVGDN